jgi:exodeoxyribonuclease V alpha subunit
MSVGPSIPVAELDPLEPRFAQLASGLLREFNRAAVISAADVHVARRLGGVGGERDESVLLAVALAVRGPRLGHVFVDLSTIRTTAAVDAEEPVDLDALPWPDPADWIARVAASPLVAPGEPGASARVAPSPVVAPGKPGASGATTGKTQTPGETQAPRADAARPLRLVGDWLYLDRYWAEEVQVARTLLRMASAPAGGVDAGELSEGLQRLFGDEVDGRQSQAAAAAVRQRFAVVAGGPGTGKTTTVARIVALLAEQARAHGSGAPLVALAAPTGKAAARLEAAVHEEAGRLDVAEPVREQLLELPAMTLHRLLGWRPGSGSRFRHNRWRRLPHDVVIVDETSMVSLSLMARLLEALRADARLVLVGDPGQLASIEAGAVLGDIVGPPARSSAGTRSTADTRSNAGTGSSAGTRSNAGTRSTAGTPSGPEDRTRGARSGIGEGIVVLERGHRFGAGIGALAAAIRGGDDDGVLALLRDPPEGVRWLEADVAGEPELPAVREHVTASARRMVGAAREGDGAGALEALGAFRILCAHRRGPHGVSTWTARTEAWLEAELGELNTGERWYVGRPLLVTENDYELGLNNGDTGVVIRSAERTVAAFERGGTVAAFSPSRLGAVDTVYAMTIHKSQGSQFEACAVLLPEPDSRLLTRELLYTAATRARRELILVGTEASIRAAVRRPVARASGLGRRLWGQRGV